MLYSQDQTWASEALERFLLKMTVMRERACTKIPYTTKTENMTIIPHWQQKRAWGSAGGPMVSGPV